MKDPPGLSRAELEFRALLRNGPEYAIWARRVREQWERANIVWHHGFIDGQAIWKVERPPDNVQTRSELAVNALVAGEKRK